MKKTAFSLLAAFGMALASVASAATNSYGIPEKIQDGNILHCFNWTFNDIKAELPSIAEAGFGAIQVSPVQGNALTNAEWFYAYMPYDFAFRANGNGSRAQLQSLCAEASKYGIKIIVDVVANHINQAPNYHDKWWDSNGRIRWNGGVDYGNRYSITHGQLGEYGDVNSEDSQVQARAKAFLEDLKSLGIAGIRWDAAKHIGLPSESCNFWSEMAKVAGLWHYGEILDGPGGDKYRLLKEYTNYIGVTDSEYSKWTLNEVESGRVPSGGGSWSANGVRPDAIVLWAESHDDYSNDGQYGKNTALVSQDKMDRAYAITACRNKETSLYFSRPSATTRATIKMGKKGSTHYTSKEVAEVNKFRNAMAGTEDYYSASNGVACITRKGGGAVIVIGRGGSGNVSVPNGGSYVKEGQYVDRVSGGKFNVTKSTISGNVGSSGIAVIYGEVIVEPSVELSPEGCEFENTLSITLTPKNFKTAWYKLGTSQQVSLTGAKTISIGSEMTEGQSISLTWGATDSKGTTKTGSATYKKVKKVVPQNAYVYLDNTDNWSEPYVWAWSESENCTASGAWPGDKMTRQSDGKYIWTAPDGKKPTLIIFSNNGHNQTSDLTFKNGATYKCDGSFSGGGDDPIPPIPPQPVQMPDHLYILGNLENNSWITSSGLPLEKTGSSFIIAEVTFSAASGEDYCFFNLTDQLGSNWDELNGKANRFGAATEGQELVVNGSAEMKKYANGQDASACKSWKIRPGKYAIEADFKNMVVKVHPAGFTGIGEIDNGDISEPVYFNLHGVLVENPEAGIYIMVKNGKSSKVIIR